MGRSKVLGFLLLLFFGMVLLPFSVIQGCRADRAMFRHSVSAQREQQYQGKLRGEDRNLRRLMIGSTMPTCTYNECRGCRFRCRAEQVPVEGNDPIHSAYHYRGADVDAMNEITPVVLMLVAGFWNPRGFR